MLIWTKKCHYGQKQFENSHNNEIDTLLTFNKTEIHYAFNKCDDKMCCVIDMLENVEMSS